MPGGYKRAKGTTYGKTEAYRYYKNKRTSTARKPLSTRDYNKILSLFFRFMFHKLLQGYTVYVPGDLGTMRLKSRKVSPGVDWNATNRLWERDEEARLNKTLVKHMNLHSDGYSYSIGWNKSFVSGLAHKRMYKFILSSTNRVYLGKLIKNNLIDSYGKEVNCL